MNHKTTCLGLSCSILLTFLFVSSTVAAQAAENDVSLGVGAQKVVSGVGVTGYSDNPQGIISVKASDDNKKIVLTGLKAGNTTLILQYGNGKQEIMTVSVFSRAPSALHNE